MPKTTSENVLSKAEKPQRSKPHVQLKSALKAGTTPVAQQDGGSDLKGFQNHSRRALTVRLRSEQATRLWCAKMAVG